MNNPLMNNNPLMALPKEALILALEQAGMNRGLAEARLAALSYIIPKQEVQQDPEETEQEPVVGYDPGPPIPKDAAPPEGLAGPPVTA